MKRPEGKKWEPKEPPERPTEGDLKDLRAWVKQRRQWWDMSVKVAWQSVVDEAYWDAADWDKFTAACILYDPPEPTPGAPNVL